MRVLVGCEESQVVCQAFRENGHDAYSNDILPTRGNPDWHIQGDVIEAVLSRDWDLIILHRDGRQWQQVVWPRDAVSPEATGSGGVDAKALGDGESGVRPGGLGEPGQRDFQPPDRRAVYPALDVWPRRNEKDRIGFARLAFP